MQLGIMHRDRHKMFDAHIYMIDLNGMSTRLWLFYAKRLLINVHYTLIFIL